MATKQPDDLRRREPGLSHMARGAMAIVLLMLGLFLSGPSAGPRAQSREDVRSRSPLAEPDAGGAPSSDPSSGDPSQPDVESEAPADVPRGRTAWPLKVVSWHLDAAAGAGAIDIKPTPQRVWRHTFGAERSDAPKSDFDVARLDADVVLLQGVRLIAHARLLFPARDWRVVISRQSVRPVLAPALAGPGWGDVERTPTTAIALRYRRGVRLAGVEHITDVVSPLAAVGGPPETAAALAVRLRIDGEIVWLVSAELPLRCVAESEIANTGSANTGPANTGGAGSAVERSCAMLSRWLSSRRPGERVVVGGPFAATAVAPKAMAANGGADPGCPRQSIAILGADTNGTTHAPSRGDALGVFMATDGAGTGCLARLDVMAAGDDPARASAAAAAPVAGDTSD